ncbi:MAG TPA: HNH endonuclease, partial [Pirellulales bacterium]|nr:HNH endonuclease [Pirellulales bacterium]
MLPQSAVDIRFHVEHIVARQHRVDNSLANLALACDRCNFLKGPNMASIDPNDGAMTRLYHPRQDAWSDHFQLDGAVIIGSTPIGRATVRLL